MVIGFIINKFRGDKGLFSEGVRIIEKRTNRPVFGVVPYFHDIHLPEEDSVALQQGKKGSIKDNSMVRIAILHLPYISNYTDFDPLEIEEDVSVWYARNPDEIEGCSIVIIPGTKNTIEDLIWLKEKGFKRALERHVQEGKTLIGICGGYQILGNSISDPYEVESRQKQINGLGFLDIDTNLEKEKNLTRVKAICRMEEINSVGRKEIEVEGYEIHMGITSKKADLNPSFTITQKNSVPEKHDDGAVSNDRKVWGTYLHGLFENDDFRTQFLCLHSRKELKSFSYRSYLNNQFDKLAKLIEENVDVQRIINIAKCFN